MPTVSPSEVVLVFIGLVVLGVLAFEVYKYLKGHPQALADLKTKVTSLESSAKTAITSDVSAIHAKLDGLVSQLTMVHAAVQAPVQLQVVTPPVAPPVASAPPAASPTSAYIPDAATAAILDARVAAASEAPVQANPAIWNGALFAQASGWWQSFPSQSKAPYTFTALAGKFALFLANDKGVISATVDQNGVVVGSNDGNTFTLAAGEATLVVSLADGASGNFQLYRR